MQNQLTSIPKSELSNLGPQEVELLKQTICKGATDVELKLFLQVCNKSGLDPFSRQIHAVKRWNAKESRNDMTIQVGIDGLRLIAARSGAYVGSDDPVYVFEKGQRFPHSASVTVWKLVGGQKCAFTATAYWEEFYPGDSQGFMWKKMPRTMLAKAAEAQALRKGFPNETSGLYIDEELHRADAESRHQGAVIEDKEAIVVDYQNKEKLLEQIKLAAGMATNDFSKEEKAQFMVEVMGVKSFNELAAKSIDDLDMILFNVNMEIKKMGESVPVEKPASPKEEVQAEMSAPPKPKTVKEASFKV